MISRAFGPVTVVAMALLHGCARPATPPPTPTTTAAAPPQPLSNAVTIIARSVPTTSAIDGVRTAADVPASETAWVEYLRAHIATNEAVADVTKLLEAKSYDSGRISLGGRINSDGQPDLGVIFKIAPHFDIGFYVVNGRVIRADLIRRDGDWTKGADGWMVGYVWF